LCFEQSANRVQLSKLKAFMAQSGQTMETLFADTEA